MRETARAALLVLMAAAGQATGALAEETFAWQGEPVEVLRVELLRGDLVVRPAAGERILVTATKRGPEAEVARVRLEVDEGGPETRIRAVHPERRGERPQTRVDVELRLPRGVRFVGQTERGDIDATGLEEPVEASTVVGDIRIRTASWATARSTNGSIVASIGRADWDGRLSFRTTNGDIRVQIPRDADLELSATSTNGRFESDLFPLERRGLPGARVRGTLGRGGRRLELESVNGDLELVGPDG